MSIVISVAGDKGSFSEQAGLKFAESLGGDDVEIDYGIDSKGVIEKLMSGEVTFGVMPTENSIGGRVKMTQDVLEGKEDLVEEVGKLKLIIEHCLYVRNDGNLSTIKRIISHPQVIKQCSIFLDDFRNRGVEIIEYQDSAIAARHLAQGIKNFDLTTAVLAPYYIHELYPELILKQRGVENKIDNEGKPIQNITTFKLFKLKSC